MCWSLAEGAGRAVILRCAGGRVSDLFMLLRGTLGTGRPSLAWPRHTSDFAVRGGWPCSPRQAWGLELVLGFGGWVHSSPQQARAGTRPAVQGAQPRPALFGGVSAINNQAGAWPHPGDPLMPVTSVAVAAAECCSFSTGAPGAPSLRPLPARRRAPPGSAPPVPPTHGGAVRGAPELSWGAAVGPRQCSGTSDYPVSQP